MSGAIVAYNTWFVEHIRIHVWFNIYRLLKDHNNIVLYKFKSKIITVNVMNIGKVKNVI